jgi:phosphoglycerate dehydrogenase-like enzyme
VNAAPIAEFVVLCILSAAKGFPRLVEASLRGQWPSERTPAMELDGSRALILGFGNVGREVAIRLEPLGVRVTGVHRHDDWRESLGEFEWIVVTAALTRESRHLVGASELEHMREDAWIFNVSRGGLIDHAALAQAILAGRPLGAYLDVTEPEPLPREHPLWSTPNVVITGHSAGRSKRSHERYATLFLDNLQRFRQGQPLRNLVDLSAGY